MHKHPIKSLKNPSPVKKKKNVRRKRRKVQVQILQKRSK